MVRYVHVVTDEWRRMAGRGRTWVHRTRAAVLAGAGAQRRTLFIRSYERGERVHLAMLSRGYSGQLPPVQSREATAPSRRQRFRARSRLPRLCHRAGGGTMTAAVAIDDVHYSYPDGTTALVGVSLTVQPGERIAVPGPTEPARRR